MNLLFASSQPVSCPRRGCQAKGKAWSGLKRLKLLSVAGILAAHSVTVFGQASVTLAWNAVTGSGVTGYRVYQGNASRSYNKAVDVANVTQTSLSGLTIGVTYYFAVTAYNSAGLESDFSNEVSYTPTGSTNATLTFAADSGTISAPFTASDGIVSQSVQTTLSGSGRAAYNFTIAKAGAYVVSAMINAPNASSNSFYVNIDAEPADPQNVWDIPVTSGFESRTVSWTTGGPPQIFNLAAGNHQLIIRGREAGTQLGTITISPAYGQLQIARAADNSVLLSGLGVIGHTYDVQASVNLTSWVTIGSVTPDQEGTFSFIDQSASSMSKRFYRLRDQTVGPLAATLKINLLASRQAALHGLGPANQSYDVQASTDLRNWIVIGALTADSSGNFSYTDNNAPSFSTRMYRLRQTMIPAMTSSPSRAALAALSKI